jgi:hypothetical protein
MDSLISGGFNDRQYAASRRHRSPGPQEQSYRQQRSANAVMDRDAGGRRQRCAYRYRRGLGNHQDLGRRNKQFLNCRYLDRGFTAIATMTTAYFGIKSVTNTAQSYASQGTSGAPTAAEPIR